MLQDLEALAAPAIVCVAFLVGTWVIVRKELAPKRRDRARSDIGAGEPAGEPVGESVSDATDGEQGN